MFLPFQIPIAQLQALRKRMFYWRAVYNYRLLLSSGSFAGTKIEYKFLRVVLLALVVKTIEKGARQEKEAYLHDYNVRKGNVEAAEKAFWDEELGLHSLDVAVAEESVYRQRQLDWKFRSSPEAHGKEMESMMVPFAAKMQ